MSRIYPLYLPALVGFSVALASANSQANLLTNPGFEEFDTPTSSTCVDNALSGWACALNGGNAFIVGQDSPFGTVVSHDPGDQSVRLTGPVDSVVYQSIPVTVGNHYEGSVWVMNYAQDPFLTEASFQMVFLGVGGGGFFGAEVARLGGLSNNSYQQLSPQAGTAVTDWTQLSLSAQAPEGAVTLRFILSYRSNLDNPVDSAIYFDDAILTESSVVPVPAAAWLFGSGLLGLIGLARTRE